MLQTRASPGTPAAVLGLKPKVPDKQLNAMSWLQLRKVLANHFLASHLGCTQFAEDLPSLPELVLKLQVRRSAKGAGVTGAGLRASC